MKILIVDDCLETKCFGVVEECKRRNIEIVVEKALIPALQRIFLDEKTKIDGIILDMGIPVYENQMIEFPNEGEEILMELKRKKVEIPVLVFSETKPKKEYEQVFDRMEDWNIKEEQEKFFAFLEYVERRATLK